MTICGAAIIVTLLGGTWQVPTSQVPDWKFNIQLPGSFVVLYLGWFLGPLQIFVTPPVACLLTILINVGVYYALVQTAHFLFFKGESKKAY